MVICPGGGYSMLADHEGTFYAHWLNRYGIACFVLKYRLGKDGYRHPSPLQDAARAVRWVRSQAAGLGLDPHRVGLMGSSAGGHLAATLATHFDQGSPTDPDPVERYSSRPDLTVLCYPVTSMGRYAHQGSKDNLLGPKPSEAQVRDLSNELQVTAQTPPCFLWHTVADSIVPMENSLLYAQALRAAGVPFELHLYQEGNHGLGLGISRVEDLDSGHELLPWTADCLAWLRLHGWLSSARTQP